MKFVCYTCGLLLRNGIPPMEALDQEQAACVGEVRDMEQRYAMLEGTLYEGMSTYQFCGFCLTMIRDYPQAMFEKNQIPGHRMHVKMYMDYAYCECECGDVDQVFTASNGRDPMVSYNRWVVKHGAEVLYPNRNTNGIDLFMPY